MSVSDALYVLRDRPFRDEELDLDRSYNPPPEHVISQFRFIRFCGFRWEQTGCKVDTGDAIFVICEEPKR